jgi:hypothetical protein
MRREGGRCDLDDGEVGDGDGGLEGGQKGEALQHGQAGHATDAAPIGGLGRVWWRGGRVPVRGACWGNPDFNSFRPRGERFVSRWCISR